MEPDQYLDACDAIDWQHPSVRQQAMMLAAPSSNLELTARRCFEFVRDQIRHSADDNEGPVTWKASQVLQQGVGFCYGKSHLLAALLRANGIPAGLCYQRLRQRDNRFCLHSLNALYLQPYGWYRVDARGSKAPPVGGFNPPSEQLPFRAENSGEMDMPEIWQRPLPFIVRKLQQAESVSHLLANLPDAPLFV